MNTKKEGKRTQMHVLVFMLYEWYFFRKNVQFSRDEHEHEHEHEKKNTPINLLFRGQKLFIVFDCCKTACTSVGEYSGRTAGTPEGCRQVRPSPSAPERGCSRGLVLGAMLHAGARTLLVKPFAERLRAEVG